MLRPCIWIPRKLRVWTQQSNDRIDLIGSERDAPASLGMYKFLDEVIGVFHRFRQQELVTHQVLWDVSADRRRIRKRDAVNDVEVRK